MQFEMGFCFYKWIFDELSVCVMVWIDLWLKKLVFLRIEIYFIYGCIESLFSLIFVHRVLVVFGIAY